MIGFIKEIYSEMQIPMEIMKICYNFYHILYKWDPRTAPSWHDRIEFNKEYDSVMLYKRNFHTHNIFGVDELKLNKIHVINFVIHELGSYHVYLGIIRIDHVNYWLGPGKLGYYTDSTAYSYSSNGYSGNYYIAGNGGGAKAGDEWEKPYKAGDKLTMIVDLISGKLDYKINEKSVNLNVNIPMDKGYKIATMIAGEPNKIQIL